MLDKLLKIYTKQQVYNSPVDLLAYSYDNSRLSITPDFVVFPHNKLQVQNTVKLCIQQKIPLIARGRGTATTGAALATKGGIIISFEKMNKIITIDVANRYVIVEPGVTNQELQDYCKAHGLFWGPNPTSANICTIGGNLACNAAGSATVKYGATKDNVLATEFIDGTGAVIISGKPVSKISAGYDLSKLIIGSEGTLGIITQATLKLTPIAETSQTVRIIYQDTQTASQAIVSCMRLHNIPSALEFLDQNAFKMIQPQIPELHKFANATMLLLKVDSSFNNIETDIENLDKSTDNSGRLDFSVAKNKQQEKNIWLARKVLSPKLKEIAPKKINEDVVVPIANLPQLLEYIETAKVKYKIMIVNFGHAGNGNIHVNLLINPDNTIELENAEKCVWDIMRKVVELNGAISGEHGIGIAKQKFLDLELNPETRQLMSRIKHAFDPHNIFNPGKGFH